MPNFEGFESLDVPANKAEAVPAVDDAAIKKIGDALKDKMAQMPSID